MTSVPATYRHGTVELSVPVEWPDGTALEVVPVQSKAVAQTDVNESRAESYRQFIERLAGSFGPEPFERPAQGNLEQREDW